MAKENGKGPVGAPRGNVNNFKHGLTMIAGRRKEKRLPRGKDKRIKLEILDALIQDAGGLERITTTKRLQAEIIATDAVFLGQMDRAVQKVFRLNPHYKENVAALAKLDMYRRKRVTKVNHESVTKL
jgi:hypothetical protein